MGMRCAIYCRISTDRTGEQLGVERQLQDCRTLVDQRQGVNVGEYIDNDRSASSGPRPEYQRLLQAVTSGTVDAIVAWAADRLYRRPVELEPLIELCDRHGVTFMLVRGSDVDLTTPSGRLVARLLGAVARHEVDAKSDRQKRESRQRADRGLPPGGRRAFGYEGSELVQGEADAVRDAYSRLLDGDTLSSIARHLDGEGWTTTMGGPWAVGAVRTMLLNPRYCGQRWHLGEYRRQGEWPAIVDEKTYEAARTILTAPGRKPAGGNQLRWLGSGLYLCGRCEVDVPMKATYRGIVARGTQARIYKCPACYITRVAEPVDKYVSLVVSARLRRPDLAGLLARPETDLRPLQVEAKALRERRKAAPRLFAQGVLSEGELVETRQAIDDRLAEIAAVFGQAGQRPAVARLLESADPGQAWLDLTDVARKQAVVRELMTIRLLPVGPGRRPFDPDTVKVL